MWWQTFARICIMVKGPICGKRQVADTFEYDVSDSSKDIPAVRELAERLREDGLRVWLDEWVIQPGDSILLAIEQGLKL